jgi:polyphosphate glucokinase
MEVLGIDVGGSGIKGAIVDISSGKLLTDRLRITTPEGAEPEDVGRVVSELVKHFEWKGLVGCGFPSLIRNGVALIAANIDQSWVGINVADLFYQSTGCQFFVVNDADAAGIAEMTLGIGKEYSNGVVLFLTLGTGIGSAIFLDGKLLPNTEFGHMEVRGKDAEKRASAAVKTHKHLSYFEWSIKLEEVLEKMELLISPDVIIIGGGVSKDAEEFIPHLNLMAKVVPAQLRNQAGIIGAALFAYQQSGQKD